MKNDKLIQIKKKLQTKLLQLEAKLKLEKAKIKSQTKPIDPQIIATFQKLGISLSEQNRLLGIENIAENSLGSLENYNLDFQKAWQNELVDDQELAKNRTETKKKSSFWVKQNKNTVKNDKNETEFEKLLPNLQNLDNSQSKAKILENNQTLASGLENLEIGENSQKINNRNNFNQGSLRQILADKSQKSFGGGAVRNETKSPWQIKNTEKEFGNNFEAKFEKQFENNFESVLEIDSSQKPMAQDIILDSVSVRTTFEQELRRVGIIFCPFSRAVTEFPELVQKYLGSVVPFGDNFFACLNLAVFSDGTFVYIPKNVVCPMDLSTYFRINAIGTGQFERTLIIADTGSSVSYLEGCTAPERKENQLHAAVVELIALEGAEIKYSTVQNWYAGDKLGVGGVYNLVTKRGICSQNAKISWTQVETGSAITWKYPSVVLKGENSTGNFYSIAITKNYQQADTGSKMIHLGNNSKSLIISKSITQDHAINSYRGLVKISPKAQNCYNFTSCDSLILAGELEPSQGVEKELEVQNSQKLALGRNIIKQKEIEYKIEPKNKPEVKQFVDNKKIELGKVSLENFQKNFQFDKTEEILPKISFENSQTIQKNKFQKSELIQKNKNLRQNKNKIADNLENKELIWKDKSVDLRKKLVMNLAKKNDTSSQILQKTRDQIETNFTKMNPELQNNSLLSVEVCATKKSVLEPNFSKSKIKLNSKNSAKNSTKEQLKDINWSQIEQIIQKISKDFVKISNKTMDENSF